MSYESENLNLEVAPAGPDHATITAVSCALLEHPLVQEHLSETRHRVLAVDLVDPLQKVTSSKAPGRYRATIYDYTNNRTLFVEGCLDEPDILLVSQSSLQPLPSSEEFDEAVSLLLNDSRIGPEIRERRFAFYRPMPPLIEEELPDGRVERTLAVGLFANDVGHRIVGVNMIRRTILHEPRDVANPSGDICGPPAAYDCAATGTTERANLKVTQGSTVLWTLTVVGPAASSGTNGSGIELRHVNYRGKQMLYRAHVPILNVQYQSAGIEAGCGPTYRDWQNSETCFEAVGTDPVPGFRLCTSPAKTILDSGSDAGNFRGVAIYVAGQEVVLISADPIHNVVGVGIGWDREG